MEKIFSQNLDANESAFFARQLEYVKSKTYDVKYPNLKATQIIPVSMEAGSGAETITYEQFDAVAIMRIISNYADDLPRADIKGKEFSSKVHSLGGSYGYNVQEIRNAAKAGTNIKDKKALAVRKANDQAVNRIAWFGDADAGLLGLLNQPNVPAATAPATGTGPSPLWSTKTAALILADLNKLVDDVIDTTQGVHTPDTVLMPVAKYTKLTSTNMGTGTDTTILEYFLRNKPFITRVEWVNELKDVAPLPSGGGGPSDVLIAMERSEENLTLEIPQGFEQFPAQERGLEFIVPAHSRIGGVIVYYPLAINIMEGI